MFLTSTTFNPIGSNSVVGSKVVSDEPPMTASLMSRDFLDHNTCGVRDDTRAVNYNSAQLRTIKIVKQLKFVYIKVANNYILEGFTKNGQYHVNQRIFYIVSKKTNSAS